jgi:hypothetical protein
MACYGDSFTFLLHKDRTRRRMLQFTVTDIHANSQNDVPNPAKRDWTALARIVPSTT